MGFEYQNGHMGHGYVMNVASSEWLRLATVPLAHRVRSKPVE